MNHEKLNQISDILEDLSDGELSVVRKFVNDEESKRNDKKYRDKNECPECCGSGYAVIDMENYCCNRCKATGKYFVLPMKEVELELNDEVTHSRMKNEVLNRVQKIISCTTYPEAEKMINELLSSGWTINENLLFEHEDNDSGLCLKLAIENQRNWSEMDGKYNDEWE